MPYAEGRVFCDADSHIMETDDWLSQYAAPDIRSRLRPLDPQLHQHRPAHLPLQNAGMPGAPASEADLMVAKEWAALGASDPAGRSRALDLLGFQRQLLFTTFATSQFRDGDVDFVYGGASAHNRAIADFCHADARMVGVGMVPFVDPTRDVRAAREAIELGCRAILVPKEPAATVAPSHPDYDPFWATLAEAGVPFMLHIGSDGRYVHPPFYKNGLLRTGDYVLDGESIQSRDFMTIYHAPEAFLTVLTLDGVFERHPQLRGACVELGAMWTVTWLRRLDMVQDIFVKTEPNLAMPMRASEYIRRAVKFTPYSHEPIGWMIEQAGDELYLFNTDYPHPEGGRNPLKRFEEHLAQTSEESKTKFYAGNFAELFDLELDALAAKA